MEGGSENGNDKRNSLGIQTRKKTWQMRNKKNIIIKYSFLCLLYLESSFLSCGIIFLIMLCNTFVAIYSSDFI